MNSDEPIWITGVGMATPLGHDLVTLENSLIEGLSGVAVVDRFCTADYPCRIAAWLPAVPCPPSQEPLSFAALSRLEQVALWCVDQALRDSDWWGRRQEVRIGLVLG